MKKKLRRRITNSELKDQRGPRLSKETIRALGAPELAQAVAGATCDTTSVTTELPPRK
jgi:hypothetical protein